MTVSLRPRDVERLRLAMAHVGSDSFCKHLRNVLRARLRFDTFLVMRMTPQTRPDLLAAQLPPTMPSSALTQYLDGAFHLDPFYLKTDIPAQGGLYRLSEIAPDRFFSSEYFIQYYSDTQLIDEIGLLAPLGDGNRAHVSISRLARTGRFRAKELACVRTFGPLLIELLFQHMAALFDTKMHPEAETPTLPDIIRAEIAARDRVDLTRREAQIAALVMRGHSNASSALKLGISRETAKVHRRNLYRKLQLSSQGELFARLKDLL
ncbi:helix-turn-helix transcriptional regulator [Sulfitobacter sp. HNIBRBA3233]|uniref:helix-turn-helix transcriptional regulator n=1 Tax=Sulfitobacter marinivivus TaxID=3158558 RepID=UPI0032DF747F